MKVFEPREFDYDLVRKLVWKFLWKSHHERHFEDCVQYCSLMWFEGRTNIQWTVIDYCRINGIGDRGKHSAKTLEYATLVGLSSDEDSDVKENGFLLENHAHEKYKEETDKDEKKNFEGILEEFLAPFNIKERTMLWAIKTYRVYKTRGKIFSTSQIRSTLKIR